MQSPFAGQGSTCGKCSATLTPDQRYCIECGERRGDPRLPKLTSAATAATQEVLPAPTAQPLLPAPTPPPSRAASGMALLTTVAVLLLAMGVGVLIGTESGGKASAQQPMLVGGTAASPTAATGATEAAGEATTAANADGETSAGVDADALAKKNGVKLAEPDVDLGDKCEKGSVGCSDDGTFDGNYFE